MLSVKSRKKFSEMPKIFFFGMCVLLIIHNITNFSKINESERHRIRKNSFSNFFERAFQISDIKRKPYITFITMSQFMKGSTVIFGDTSFVMGWFELQSMVLIKDLKKESYADQIDINQLKKLENIRTPIVFPFHTYLNNPEIYIFSNEKSSVFYTYYHNGEILFVAEEYRIHMKDEP
jgi:hypothetical protein